MVKAKGHSPERPIYVWQIGSDGAQNLFAVTRTPTHARNVDPKELGGCLGAAASLEEVYNDNLD